MTFYYVATLTFYVLVEAASESEARELALPKLDALYANVWRRRGRRVPIQIRTVRPATGEEIALQRWHDEQVALQRSIG